MKIKLMIVSLVAVLGLQGSHLGLQGFEKPLPYTLKEALYTLAVVRNQNNASVILYSDKTWMNIISAVEDIDIKQFMADNDICNVMVVSDTLTKKRTIVDIVFGQKTEAVCHDQHPHYSKSTITQRSEFQSQNEYDEFIDSLEKHKGVAICNIHHGKGVTMDRFVKEIQAVQNNKDVSLLVIVGQNYNGVDIATVCEVNGAKPIVLNKPETGIIIWCKKHWMVMSGASLIALLGVIYHYRHLLIKS